MCVCVCVREREREETAQKWLDIITTQQRANEPQKQNSQRRDGDGNVFLPQTHKITSKLQALVYNILPLEEGAGKQCSEYEWPDDCHRIWTCAGTIDADVMTNQQDVFVDQEHSLNMCRLSGNNLCDLQSRLRWLVMHTGRYEVIRYVGKWFAAECTCAHAGTHQTQTHTHTHTHVHTQSLPHTHTHSFIHRCDALSLTHKHTCTRGHTHTQAAQVSVFKNQPVLKILSTSVPAATQSWRLQVVAATGSDRRRRMS